MTLTIEIPPDLEARLEAEAARRGVDASDYARLILEERLLSGQSKPFWATASKEEWLRAFNQWMDNQDATLPPLPDEATRRESFYGDRG